MTKPKKILNDPSRVVTELLDGLVLASDGRLVRLEGKDAIVRSQIPNDKVALLIGGGSGHEPMFPGFIGENLADGAACGQVFAAPAPDLVLAATQAVNRGRGVLYVYGNYAGDNMNFDIGAELAADEGINVRTVRVWDDVAASAARSHHRPTRHRRRLLRDQDRRRRGGDSWTASTRCTASPRRPATTRARWAWRSPPARSRKPAPSRSSSAPTRSRSAWARTASPGISRQKLTTADAITEQMMAAILPDLPFRSGDEVALLINNLGATTMMELLVVNRCVRQDSRQGGDCGPSHRYRLVSDVSGDGRAVDHAAAARR